MGDLSYFDEADALEAEMATLFARPSMTREEFDRLMAGLVERDLWLSCEPVGSRVTCVPPPTDTDEDFLVLVDKARLSAFRFAAEGAGFDRGGSELVDGEGIDASPFMSLKCGDINLIVTADEDFHRRFLAASSVAKRLNLLDKEDRIALFQAVLYGNPC